MSEYFNNTGSPSYATPSKSREQWAQHIANGYPSPVSYTALKPVVIYGLLHYVDALPIHMRRKA